MKQPFKKIVSSRICKFFLVSFVSFFVKLQLQFSKTKPSLRIATRIEIPWVPMHGHRWPTHCPYLGLHWRTRPFPIDVPLMAHQWQKKWHVKNSNSAKFQKFGYELQLLCHAISFRFGFLVSRISLMTG